ncbi:DEAD box ATP-dependent RNA helicase, partial [Reticulomyxa filosa]
IYGYNKKIKKDNLMRLVPIRDNPSIIDLTPRHRTNQLVAQYRILSDEDDKDTLLYSLVYSFHYQNMKGKNSVRTIVFANTIGTVKRVSIILQQLKFNVWCLHAQQQQKQRLKNLDRFISGNNTILVCSDVAARGLDIPSIDYVIHFNVPLSAEDYIHRTGRVVRQVSSAADIPVGDEHKEVEKKGMSVLMISPREVNMYHKILSALKIPQGIAKYNVNERIIPMQMGDLKRLADAADIELDEINVPKKMKKHLQNDEEQTPDQQQLKVLQLKLDEMLKMRQWDIDRPKSTYLTKMRLE